MKILIFDKGIDDKKFELLYSGFIIGGTYIPQKGLPILRREIQVLDKLESISKECQNGKKIIGDEPIRELTGGTIELTGPEYEMVNSYLCAVPWSSGRTVRDAVATIDWLASL